MDAEVNIIDFDFDPKVITIPLGLTVTWINVGPTDHTVADKTLKVFSSDILKKGESYSFTPKKRGTIEYWCTLHPDMLGTLVVK